MAVAVAAAVAAVVVVVVVPVPAQAVVAAAQVADCLRSPMRQGRAPCLGIRRADSDMRTSLAVSPVSALRTGVSSTFWFRDPIQQNAHVTRTGTAYRGTAKSVNSQYFQQLPTPRSRARLCSHKTGPSSPGQSPVSFPVGRIDAVS